MGAQQNAEWYDEWCRRTAITRSEPPWCSPWFLIWERVVALLVGDGLPMAVVELGCGPGAMAEMIHAKFPNVLYLGADFSSVNIQLAQGRGLPKNYYFTVRDLVLEPVTINMPHETRVVTVEFLEHIIDDLFVLECLPVGTQVIFAVPDHDSAGHVRWFKDSAAVDARYRPLFSDLSVEALQVQDHQYFIGSGHRSAKVVSA